MPEDKESLAVGTACAISHDFLTVTRGLPARKELMDNVTHQFRFIIPPATQRMSPKESGPPFRPGPILRAIKAS